MKKFYLLLAILSAQFSSAQNMLNPSFDSVYFGGIDRVFQWITSDGVMMNAGTSSDTVNPLTPNTHYEAIGLQFQELLWMGQETDTSSHSSIALKLNSHPEKFKTNGAHYPSSVVNGTHFYTDADGYLDVSRCGIAFPYRPTKLKGIYQFKDFTAIGLNFGRCVILLKKWNTANHQSDTVAFVESTFDLSPTQTWKNFEIPIAYQSTQMPDTLVVAFFANTRPDQASSMWLDELSFDYSGIGITEENIESTRIYPNPNAGLIHIDSKTAIYSSYSIYNSMGQKLKGGSVSSNISIEEIEPQVLYLELLDENGKKQTFKIIKAK